MEKKNHPRDWCSKFQKNFDLYGGRLTRLFKLNQYDVGVYVFLLTRKWYDKQSQFSKNRITNELNSIPSHYGVSEHQIKYDARKVESSLIKLENYGFVKKCKNDPKKKVGHRNPDFIYESRDITELQPELKQELEIQTKDMLGLLDELGNIEEDAMYYKSQMKEESNGEE